MHTVLLTSGSVGTIAGTAAVGQEVAIVLADDNGNPITETGEVAEVLE